MSTLRRRVRLGFGETGTTDETVARALGASGWMGVCSADLFGQTLAPCGQGLKVRIRYHLERSGDGWATCAASPHTPHGTLETPQCGETWSGAVEGECRSNQGVHDLTVHDPIACFVVPQTASWTITARQALRSGPATV